MRIFRDSLYLDDDARGAAVAIGNFDGVHLGHRAVIDAARDEAERLGAPLGVLTFEPHPRQVFAPDAPPFRLMNAETRAHRLKKIGINYLYELPFTRQLASLTPEAFARDVLAGQLGLSHAVIGGDFRFGQARAGDAAMLAELGERYGFTTSTAPLLELGGLQVSSTAIREALTEGRPRDAAAMLGHWHRIDGEVIRGDQRGRDLGYPTANLSIAGLHPPRFGVYAVRVSVLDGPHEGEYDGAASIGVRPTFGVNAPNCETYLLDFRGDLYAAHISVALVEYLRPELKFDGVEPLIAQMEKDVADARAILANA
ncbi:bifunctional riboflavin kinase/FAD synthetase [Pseudoroseicyclus tamaricis]|uniref:Riboflavin biosynthesis protein n=1 Tax=Pseudoroseicyclus tamaricis TaxID=2705421 RepID=A0A6B2JFT6_9RHOB|nr:bifunctional riboflavin kinase/FAD synthetase [Pseudoroseicyclus tamaricis]NDU99932.1 bifunctional riboflavin kinase/FAD synthetase [Pseudoroseicyclus tamaricis]